MSDETKDVETTEGETVETQEKEKKFTQDEVNKLMAKEKRAWEKRYETLQTEFTTFKGEIETERTKQEEKLKTQVDELKKGMPPQILKLLEKLSVQEQYEYLTDSENKIEKKRIPETPPEKKGEGDGKQKVLGTFI